jgi:hypothetical protein
LGGLFGVVLRFDWIETLGRRSWEMYLLFRGWEAARLGSARGEGESPTVELVDLGGEKARRATASRGV